MFKILTRTKAVFILLPLAVLGAANTNAETMAFSYIFTEVNPIARPWAPGATLSGQIDGTVDPMNSDRVIINAFHSVVLRRPAFGLSDFVYDAITATEFNTSPIPGNTPVMSFSGLILDFRSCPEGFIMPFDDCNFGSDPGGGFLMSYGFDFAPQGFATAADGSGDTELCFGGGGLSGCRAVDIPIFLENWRLVRVDSDDDLDSVPNADDLCPNTVIPESVPGVSLKPNNWALVTGDFKFDTTITGNGRGPNRSYLIEDTAGCSCEQIVALQGLGDGHTKHGCSISAMDDWVDAVNMP